MSKGSQWQLPPGSKIDTGVKTVCVILAKIKSVEMDRYVCKCNFYFSNDVSPGKKRSWACKCCAIDLRNCQALAKRFSKDLILRRMLKQCLAGHANDMIGQDPQEIFCIFWRSFITDISIVNGDIPMVNGDISGALRC